MLTTITVHESILREWDGILEDGTSASSAQRVQGTKFNTPDIDVATTSESRTLAQWNCKGQLSLSLLNQAFSFSISVPRIYSMRTSLRGWIGSLQARRSVQRSGMVNNAIQSRVRFSPFSMEYWMYMLTREQKPAPGGAKFDVGNIATGTTSEVLSDWNLATNKVTESAWTPIRKANIGTWETSQMPESCTFDKYKADGSCTVQWKYPTKLVYSEAEATAGAKAEFIAGATRCEGRNADGLPALSVGGIGDLFTTFDNIKMCAGGGSKTGCEGMAGFECVDFKQMLMVRCTCPSYVFVT